jgi:uncharacterized DUF497 family protein
MRFSWDPNKDRLNQRHHRINFQEATTVFGDSLAVTVSDPSSSGQLLVVCHVEQGDTIRIISARRATTRERKDYET